jgi:23S rRNA (guanosine2251-2'-O)-methyltransferase
MSDPERARRVVYGVHPVEEALAARPPRGAVLHVERGKHDVLANRAESAGVQVQRTSREALVQLSGSPHHQGAVLSLPPYEYAEVEDLLAAAESASEAPLLVVLDGITDPQNLGACLRSAHMLGSHGVIVPKDRAVAVTPAVVKASAGAAERVRVARVVNLSRTIEDLKERGVWSVAALAPGARERIEPPWALDLAGPTALVVGAEGSGIRPLVARTCDFGTTIPMTGEGVGSLNAAAAAAVLLYEARRQRSAALKSASKPPVG